MKYINRNRNDRHISPSCKSARQRVGNGGAGNATIYSVGAAYYLSKRTMVDAQLAKVVNSATGPFGLEANLPGNSDNPLPGHGQTGFYVGIDHSF